MTSLLEIHDREIRDQRRSLIRLFLLAIVVAIVIAGIAVSV
jgi:hypothetical protein